MMSNRYLLCLFSMALLFILSSENIMANEVRINSFSSWSQNIIVSGKVTDSDGEPLIGVNIQVKDTDIGTSTDFDGEFVLEEIDENAVLVFSYVGYQKLEVPVEGRTSINVEMITDAQMLDEVIVVGFGTQKKVNPTGAVSTLNVDESITSRGIPNASSMMQGLIPGLAVNQNSGMAGNNEADLMIR